MFATKNYLVETAVVNDLTRLKDSDPGNTVAYDRIETIEAWEAVDDANPMLFPVRVGVIDSGITSNHPEFLGVDFGAEILPRGFGVEVLPPRKTTLRTVKINVSFLFLYLSCIP